jgi:stage II sporulation protein D
MSPINSTMIRQDQSEVSDISLLPSAFFYIDRKEEDGKLTGFTLYGGGYGHGVGMSQNGVKALSDAGKEYEEIINYFYQGTQMGFIYE